VPLGVVARNQQIVKHDVVIQQSPDPHASGPDLMHARSMPMGRRCSTAALMPTRRHQRQRDPAGWLPELNFHRCGDHQPAHPPTTEKDPVSAVVAKHPAFRGRLDDGMAAGHHRIRDLDIGGGVTSDGR
jgi:hypothetical protein